MLGNRITMAQLFSGNSVSFLHTHPCLRGPNALLVLFSLHNKLSQDNNAGEHAPQQNFINLCFPEKIHVLMTLVPIQVKKLTALFGSIKVAF